MGNIWTIARRTLVVRKQRLDTVNEGDIIELMMVASEMFKESNKGDEENYSQCNRNNPLLEQNIPAVYTNAPESCSREPKDENSPASSEKGANSQSLGISYESDESQFVMMHQLADEAYEKTEFDENEADKAPAVDSATQEYLKAFTDEKSATSKVKASSKRSRQKYVSPAEVKMPRLFSDSYFLSQNGNPCNERCEASLPAVVAPLDNTTLSLTVYQRFPDMQGSTSAFAPSLLVVSADQYSGFIHCSLPAFLTQNIFRAAIHLQTFVARIHAETFHRMDSREPLRPILDQRAVNNRSIFLNFQLTNCNNILLRGDISLRRSGTRCTHNSLTQNKHHSKYITGNRLILADSRLKGERTGNLQLASFQRSAIFKKPALCNSAVNVPRLQPTISEGSGENRAIVRENMFTGMHKAISFSSRDEDSCCVSHAETAGKESLFRSSETEIKSEIAKTSEIAIPGKRKLGIRTLSDGNNKNLSHGVLGRSYTLKESSLIKTLVKSHTNDTLYGLNKSFTRKRMVRSVQNKRKSTEGDLRLPKEPTASVLSKIHPRVRNSRKIYPEMENSETKMLAKRHRYAEPEQTFNTHLTEFRNHSSGGEPLSISSVCRQEVGEITNNFRTAGSFGSPCLQIQKETYGLFEARSTEEATAGPVSPSTLVTCCENTDGTDCELPDKGAVKTKAPSAEESTDGTHETSSNLFPNIFSAEEYYIQRDDKDASQVPSKKSHSRRKRYHGIRELFRRITNFMNSCLCCKKRCAFTEQSSTSSVAY